MTDPRKECKCTAGQIQKYLRRLSGPLLDRIDIHIDVPPVAIKELSQEAASGESSKEVRQRVVAARDRQLQRFQDLRGIYCNAQMGKKQIKQFCELNPEAKKLLEEAMLRLSLTARAYDRIRKVARTIADLTGSESIQVEHVAEAIQYRSLDRQLWL